jgi:enterochelin esterase-like enzyme
MNDDRYTKRTIVKEEVRSAFLPEARSVKIYMPPGYNELMSYPVLYCQDGEDFFNFGRTATTITRLILDEGLEPALVVGVDVDKRVRTDEYSPDGSRFEAYCRFFAEELVPYIEERYPARRERADRVIAGDSLGGTVSLHLALEYPELFNRVLSLSGAFLESTRSRLAAESDLSWLELYMLIGLQETAVETSSGTFDFLNENRLTRTMLEAKGTKLVYEEKDGKHIWGFWQKELPGALTRFFG